MDSYVYYNRGKSRELNEDNYLLALDNHFLSRVAVADGMGGHRAGEVASKMAVEFIEGFNFGSKDRDEPPGEYLKEQIIEAIEGANRKIFKAAEKNSNYQGMGTTLSLGVFHKDKLFIGHVGDSRIYLYRDGKLKKLTRDHTLVNELVKKDSITREEAFNHPRRHILTQALGQNETLEIYSERITLSRNDLILFCTDGLTDRVNDKQIVQIINNNGNISLLAEELGNRALSQGGNDNITLLLVCYNN